MECYKGFERCSYVMGHMNACALKFHMGTNSDGLERHRGNCEYPCLSLFGGQHLALYLFLLVL